MKRTALDHLNLGIRLLEALVAQNKVSDGKDFRHALDELKQARAELQLDLPGLELVGLTHKTQGSQLECETFAISIGLPAGDGEWFFCKMQGCGWKNNGKPVNDWRATMRSWKMIGCMASQKKGGNGAVAYAQRTRFQIESEIKAVENRIKQIKAMAGMTYDGQIWHGRLPQKELETVKKLRADIRALQEQFDQCCV